MVPNSNKMQIVPVSTVTDSSAIIAQFKHRMVNPRMVRPVAIGKHNMQSYYCDSILRSRMCAKLSIAFLSKEKICVKMEISSCMTYSDFKGFMGWLI